MKLTDAVIKKLDAPEKGYNIILDTEARGFAVRITAKGVRSFILNYYIRGRDRCITIGQFPAWGTTAARARANELRHEIDNGNDPQDDNEAERSAPTVAELIYRSRPSTCRASARARRRNTSARSPTTSAPISASISRSPPLPSPTWTRCTRRSRAAAHVCRQPLRCDPVEDVLARGALGHARNEPVQGRRAPHRAPSSAIPLGRRTRAAGGGARSLSRPAGSRCRPDTVAYRRSSRRGAGHALGRTSISARASGPSCRRAPSRSSITRCRSQHRSAPCWPASARSKPRSDRPLVFVFPSTGATGHLVEIKKAWATIIKAAGIENLRLHDLRHSYASALVSSGASLPLIGSLLGHASPATTARYSHMFADPQRAAAEKIGALIENAARQPRPTTSCRSRRKP